MAKRFNGTIIVNETLSDAILNLFKCCHKLCCRRWPSKFLVDPKYHARKQIPV